MAEKNISRTNIPSKTNSRDIETSFSFDSKIKNVKYAEMLSKLSPSDLLLSHVKGCSSDCWFKAR